MISFSPNWRQQNHRLNNPTQANLRIESLLDTIETLRDVQVEMPRLKHEARCIERILWRRIGVML